MLGKIYNVDPSRIDDQIEELLEMLYEVDYHHNIQKNRDAVLELMKEYWD